MHRPIIRKILLGTIFLLVLSNPCVAAPKVGVVLGGGAARGFSHIGLIQALEENGVPIDLLVGTSMGSIVAGLYASGYSVDNMQQIVSSLDTAALIDLAIPPKGGLIQSARFQHCLDVLLEHKTFSQLDIPFYSVITNVRTGEEVALNDGPVSVGIQASMSIPALFPPVLINGQYYVDGGMKNAVPANVAQDHGADVVIAVDVKKELQEIDYDNVLTNMQLSMWFMIDGYVQTNAQAADVIIVPEVKYDSYMDYQKVEPFIREGYLAGLAHMEQIKAAILALDPSFEFIPYAQQGLSRQETTAITATAMDRAASLPRPLSIAPILTRDPLDDFAQIGFKVGHGPLLWFDLGYCYGFSPAEGGHEVFLEWSREHLASVGVFVRKSAHHSQLTWGGKFIVPVGRKLELGGVYLSQGPTEWQLSGTGRRLWEWDRLHLDVTAKVIKDRDPDLPLRVSGGPTVRYFFGTEPRPVLEAAMIRPYGYGGLEVTTPIDHWDTEFDYELGLGSEFRLFGLYPLDASVGLKIEPGNPNVWLIRIRGGSF